MKILQLEQGSDQWLAHRRTTRNASEAPALMGASPYTTRAQLIRQRATGVEPEIDAATQARFDRGHEVEPALRAIAEEMIGQEFYPVTGVSDDDYLGASFDGVTLAEDIILEAKQYNASKVATMREGTIPAQDYWQVVQQFAVCDSAERCLYVVGDGTPEGTEVLQVPRSDVAHDIPKLRAAWEQFDIDVAAYVPEAAPGPTAPGTAPTAFPVLSVVARGMVEFSNLDEFREKALAAIGAVNRDLQTDDDFATAELTVKAFKSGEEKLDATKRQILGQMADVDAVMRTIDEVSEQMRRVRLDLDKLVKAEKENRKSEIVQKARAAYGEHETGLRAETKDVWIALPAPDFAGAIKGKRTLSSMQDAVDTVLANAKIAANESAKHIRAALACLSEETEGHKHLFPDYRDFISKPIDDIKALVRGRIAEHKQREADRLEKERERIRQEEAERLERERAAEEAERQKREQAAATEPAHQAEPEKPLAAEPAPARSAPTLATSTPAPDGLADARLRLGDINARIAPLSITAEGLGQLGFQPAETKGAAKLYRLADLPVMLQRMTIVLADAEQQEAA